MFQDTEDMQQRMKQTNIPDLIEFRVQWGRQTVNKVTKKFIEVIESKKYKFGKEGKKCQDGGKQIKF